MHLFLDQNAQRISYVYIMMLIKIRINIIRMSKSEQL